jgi:hypothetical protein
MSRDTPKLLAAVWLPMAWLLAPAVWAGEETVVVPEVEVRSGPSHSPLFYPTGKLRAGDRVQVVGEPENGFLKIVPPAGSYSLILKREVRLLDAQTGQVVSERAMTVMGGLTPTYNVRGTYLPQGTLVTVLGSEEVRTPQGVLEYYKIVPVNEFRYIPTAAVRRTAEQAGSSPATAWPSSAETPAGRLPPEIAAQLEAADQAYRRGQTTGDWSEAIRLYQQLEHSPHHEARLTAWNRLEFIRQRQSARSSASGPVQPASFRDTIGPGGSSRSSPPSSRYTYVPDDGWKRPPPERPQDAPPAAALTGGVQPASGAGDDKNFTPAGQQPPATVMIGRLVRSSKTDINGRPLYALVDAQNQIKCYVSGPHLERYLEQNVRVEGDGLVYQAYLRNHLLRVSDIRPLR